MLTGTTRLSVIAALAIVPISFLVALLHAPAIVIFSFACLSLMPLAGILGTATEQISLWRGPAVGGLLNATFGNATELIFSVIALRQGQLELVRASLIGSVIGNILLVLGVSALLGGLKHRVLKFNAEAAQAHATMMALSAIALLVPALFVWNLQGTHSILAPAKALHLSFGVALVLLAVYLGGLLFSLRTHESLFRSVEEEKQKPSWKQGAAAAILAVTTVVIAAESEFLVGSLHGTVQTLGLSPVFVGLIIIPIVGNAAEHGAAILMAMANRMDVSLSIAVSSSTQIAMFVIPVLVFLSIPLGHPMSILFTPFELVALTVSVLIATVISSDGKSHWLEGAQLVAVYLVLALSFYYVGS